MNDFNTNGATISPTMNIAIIDNYDSFTYNLVHLIASLGDNASLR